MSGAIAQPNPLSIAFTKTGFDPENPGIIAVTRHPILWSFGLWASAHIPPNGDLVAVVLFGILTLFAFAGMALIDRKAHRTMGPADWHRLADKTSLLPFAAIAQGRTRWPRSRSFHLAVAIGLALYALFVAVLHEWWFGVAPLSYL